MLLHYCKFKRLFVSLVCFNYRFTCKKNSETFILSIFFQNLSLMKEILRINNSLYARVLCCAILIREYRLDIAKFLISTPLANLLIAENHETSFESRR